MKIGFIGLGRMGTAMAKDIGLTLAAADSLMVPMPLAGLLRDRFLRLLAHGGENMDWSAIGGLASEDAQSRAPVN